MPTVNESTTLYHNGWIVKIHPPDHGPTNQMILLLHGYSGDENSMDVFTRSLPRDAWLISPRAPFLTSTGGYSWSSISTNSSRTTETLIDQARLLWFQIPEWQKLIKAEEELSRSIVGFSQGGAMALLISLLYPSQVIKTACLSGYLPEGTETLLPYNILQGRQYLIAHGIDDDIVPVERARQAAQYLQAHGAQVTYCENKVGHKVAASCLHSLSEFFR